MSDRTKEVIKIINSEIYPLLQDILIQISQIKHDKYMKTSVGKKQKKSLGGNPLRHRKRTSVSRKQRSPSPKRLQQHQLTLEPEETDNELKKQLKNNMILANNMAQDLKQTMDNSQLEKKIDEVSNSVQIIHAKLDAQSDTIENIKDNTEHISHNIDNVRNDISKQTKILLKEFDKISSILSGGCFTQQIRIYQEKIHKLNKEIKTNSQRYERSQKSYKVPELKAKKEHHRALQDYYLEQFKNRVNFEYTSLEYYNDIISKSDFKDVNKFPCPRSFHPVTNKYIEDHDKECPICGGSGFLPSDYVKSIIHNYNELSEDNDDDMMKWTEIEEHVLPQKTNSPKKEYSEDVSLIRAFYLRMYCAWLFITTFLKLVWNFTIWVLTIAKNVLLFLPNIAYDLTNHTLGWICCIGPILAVFAFLFVLISELILIHKVGGMMGISYIISKPFRLLMKSFNHLFTLIASVFEMIKSEYTSFIDDMYEIIREEMGDVLDQVSNAIFAFLHFFCCTLWVGVGGASWIPGMGNICEGYFDDIPPPASEPPATLDEDPPSSWWGFSRGSSKRNKAKRGKPKGKKKGATKKKGKKSKGKKSKGKRRKTRRK